MYRVTLSASNIDLAVGLEAAADIEREFRDHRDWHQDVRCVLEGTTLVLTAVNDFDEDGRALLDEFGDCLVAYLSPNDGDLRIVSVEVLAE